jgi:anaerobic magnesium-protoporphyrin IX monomethyl ester cyclase
MSGATMNILLVNPITFFDGDFLLKSDRYRIETHPFMNMGLLYLGTVAEKLGHKVMIKKAHYSNFKIMLKKYNPSILGITCMTPQYNLAKKLAKIAKDFNRNIIIILGGYFPTFMWKYIIRNTSLFDYLFIRESEETFKEFLMAIEHNKNIKNIRGIAFRENNKIIFTGERDLKKNIDSYSLPARRLFKIPTIITSRGCPNNCKFCTIKNFYKRTYRERSMQNIVEELKIMKKQGIKAVHIRDDNFLIRRKKIFEFEKILKENNLKFDFVINTDIRQLKDDNILKTMKKIGVKTLRVGIQYNYLKNLNMPTTRIDVENFFKKIKNYGFHVDCFVIINKGDKKEELNDIKKELYDIKKLARNSSKADLNIGYYVMTPFPGSDIYEEFKKNNIRIDNNWSLINTAFCVYEYNDFNEKNIESLLSNIAKNKNSFSLKDLINMFWFVSTSSLSNVFKIKVFSDYFKMVLQGKSKYQMNKFITRKYF